MKPLKLFLVLLLIIKIPLAVLNTISFSPNDGSHTKFKDVKEIWRLLK